jgi:hypothetical protein
LGGQKGNLKTLPEIEVRRQWEATPRLGTMIGHKGIAVLIDQSIHDFVTVWNVSEQIQAIRLKCVQGRFSMFLVM